MISGKKTVWLEILMVALAMLVVMPARALDLPDVMALLAQRKSGEARFTEERIVSSLDSPLMSTGMLSFAAPDRFSRTTDGPRPESMEVQGNNLVLRRAGRTRQLALDTMPELAAMVNALRGALTGDAGALLKHFRVATSGDAGKWELVLTPLDARLASQVRQLEIVGKGPDLRSIGVILAGGDRSLMQIQPLGIAPKRPASAP